VKERTKAVQTPFVSKEIFARAKVSPKGWIVIPKAIRDEMGLRPGDDVTLNLSPPSGNMRQDKAQYAVQLRRVPEDAAKRGRGLFARRPGQRSLAQELVEEHRLEVQNEERELRARPRRRRQRI
jgi:AbrB family looped-hinge helix DNA binding protein